MKKSEPESVPELPFSFHPCSNGEYEPPPVTARDIQAEEMYRRLVDEKSRRLGMTRRAFTESASGMAAALFVMNQVYGCSSKGAGSAGGGGSGGGGVGGGGVGGGGGFTRDAGFDVAADVSAADAAQADADARYDVGADQTENQDAARDAVAGEEFIFDVQTHNRVPRPPWNASICSMTPDTSLCPRDYISGIFVASDTDVACLSGFPATRANDAPSTQTRGRIKEIVDQLSGSPRLVIHANARPNGGTAELDAMSADAAAYPIVAWKTYPGDGALNTDPVGRTFIERARQTGIRIIASHRGIGDDGSWTGAYSPRDIPAAAAMHPDFKFLVYHSGWQNGVNENHPFNTADAAPMGVDRLIKAVLDNGLGPTSNIYAELGTTWFSLRNDMAQAAHVLGKLLRYLGPDRILWGTDSFNNGGPQQQISAFRAFQIPQAMQDMYGYPALTAEVKAKILGLNAASLYGVDVQAVRRQITQDDVSRIVLARREDPRAYPLGPTPHGPRTRREYLAFLRWSGEA
jgi:uncharacterized protein